MAQQLAEAARALVGVPFRLHGRDPATGLDCIGVLAHALHVIGRPVLLPEAYCLRAQRVAGLSAIAERCGFVPATGNYAPGDVLFARIGPVQHHLLIAAGDGRYVHAHAGHRRVVIGALGEGWKVVGHWRLDPDFKG
jgi:cell wall-associated NlpC family hydrolase